ncbi:hypothetical protein DXG01_009106 [Tephrocybe rancida]|nr:hypothetical protein DXG01_009106 [Tephrocybe rancida]
MLPLDRWRSARSRSASTTPRTPLPSRVPLHLDVRRDIAPLMASPPHPSPVDQLHTLQLKVWYKKPSFSATTSLIDATDARLTTVKLEFDPVEMQPLPF